MLSTLFPDVAVAAYKFIYNKKKRSYFLLTTLILVLNIVHFRDF